MTNVDYGAINEWNKSIIDEFRGNGGRVGGPFEGRPMVLVTIKGRKTGIPRTTPLVYLPDPEPGGDRVFVFASKGGAPEDPDWYKNLVANPDVTVEIGDQEYAARAVVITGEERDALFEQQMKAAEQFRSYQMNTTRVIPVIELIRA
jgi:deazaflavin-dependent oxidoreductase (nitroreductase family)